MKHTLATGPHLGVLPVPRFQGDQLLHSLRHIQDLIFPCEFTVTIWRSK